VPSKLVSEVNQAKHFSEMYETGTSPLLKANNCW
jgi:hypothetical protein